MNIIIKIKNNKITTSIIVGLVIISLIASYFMFFGKEAEAAWFNESWYYRKAIPITAHTSQESNVYISVTVNTSDTNKFQADCGDLRFTKQSGQLLDYYIVSGCGTASTVVHVNFDIFPAGSQTIYMYYGNPSADNGFSASDFSTEASNYTLGSIAAEEIGPGPVAYWSFDSGYGTVAQDKTANNNDGAITGATWQSEDMCISGKCLYFDNDDKVQIPSDDDFNSDTLTIEMWLKLNETGKWFGIYRAGGDDRWYFYYDTSANSEFSWFTNTVRHGIYGGTPNVGVWHHFAIVIEPGNQYSYMDGLLIAHTTVSDGLTATSGDIKLGEYGSPGDYSLQGFIDEVKIYNYARSATEIKADYTAGTSGMATSKGVSVALGGSSNKWLSDGLVGYWKMDESSWGTPNCSDEVVLDSSGNGNNGKACPATTGPTGAAAGKFGNAGDFDGEDDYINLVTATTLGINDATSPFTMAFWFKTNAAGEKYFIDNYDGGAGDISIRLDGGKIETFLQDTSGNNNGTPQYGSGYNDDSWHHVVITWNGAGKEIVYVDGSSLGSTNSTTITGSFETGAAFQFAARPSGPAYLDGEMDEVRIYNRALSPKEVRDLYNWAPGPVAYYNFDENTGTSNVYDRSGNENKGTMNGSMTESDWVPGKYGSALDFDGEDDYVDCGSEASIRGQNFTAGTWEAWIYLKSKTPNQQIIYQSEGGGQSYRLWVYTSKFRLSTYGLSPGTFIEYAIPDSALNTWLYLVGTWDGSYLRLYLNGELKAGPDAVSGTMIASTDPLLIGGTPLTNYFNGLIDEVRIYNYARTQKQIIEDMNAGHPAVGSPVGSAVGYWKFDEGYGTSANDSSANRNTCSFSGGANWTNSGRLGKAVSYDGVNGQLDCGSDSSIDIDGQDFTITGWIKPEAQGTYRFAWHKERPNLYLYTDDQTWKFEVQSDGSNKVLSLTAPMNGSWYYVVQSFKCNEYHKAWIYDTSGGLVDSGSRTDVTTPTGSDDDSFLLSRSGWHADNNSYFKGLIDEVKIYNYALTEDEIRLDYNRGAAMLMGATSTDASGNPDWSSAREYCIPGDTTSCSAPVAEWKFDEKTGDYAYDTSGNGNKGTLTNMESLDWKSAGECKQGACLDFDGNNEYVNCGNNSSLQTFTALTLEAWVYPTSFTSYTAILGKNTDYYYGVKSPGNVLYLRHNDLTTGSGGTAGWTDVTLDSNLTTNEWHHIAVTWDGDEVAIYLNGIYKGGETSVTGTTSNTTDELAIGNYMVPGGSGHAFPGKIDHVKIYDYARTPAQIAWDYNRGGPVGWWKFDEGEGMIAHDSSGNENHGDLEASMTSDDWVDGKHNTALDFDGVDDYVDCGNDESLDITDAITISAWVKPFAVIDHHQVVLNKYGSSNLEGVRMGYISGVFRGYWGNGAVRTYIQADSNPVLNEWTHTVIVFGDSGKAKMYLNGIIQSDIKDFDFISNADVGSFIGSLRGVAQYFNGLIDDVRIYNYALTPLQVKNLYNQGSSVRFGP